MKKLLIILTLLGFAGIGIYIFASKNLAINPSKEQIAQNNNDTSENAQNTDYTNLVNKEIKVTNSMKKGVFSTQRYLNIPENMEVSVFFTGLDAPRQIAVDSSGGVYVTDKGAGKVAYLEDTNKDGVADNDKTIDENLRNVHGIEFYNGDLFVAEEHQVTAYRGINKGSYEKKEVIIIDLPSGNTLTGGGHTTRTIRIGPDKKIYLAVGSSCNVCEEDDERRAAILRYDLDGSNEQIFARGLRNTVDFIFDGNKIWGVDNGRDLIGDDLPPEEVNIIQVGSHYGWPYCYGDKITNPEYTDKQEYCDRNTIAPAYEMQAHSAPLGLVFSPWKDLDRNLIVAFHGSWNRTTPTGYKIIRIDTKDVRAKPTNLITGWLEENGKAWGRPVDVKVYMGDKLLITDDASGTIYLVKRL